MSLEESRAIVQRLIDEAWNRGNLEILDEVYTANYVRHIPPFPDIEGFEAIKQYIADCLTSYPDLQVTIDEIMVVENTIVFRWTYEGTQTGQSPTTGIAPTGKKVIFSGCTVSHTVGDKIVEEWVYADFLGLLQQLGAAPSMRQGEE